MILFTYINYNYNREVEYVTSKIDGHAYLVRSLPNKQHAADYLADINRDIIKMIKHLLAKYPDNPDYQRLYDNFDPTAVSEGSPDSQYTSYTVNKTALVICIRQSDNSFVDKNILMYPVLHELGHMACKEIGHTPMYWKIFKHIITEAIDIGIYTKVDFKNEPKDYCGIKISSSIV